MRQVHAIHDVAAIDCRLVTHDWDFARVETARINAHWRAARQAKPQLFDGRVLIARDLAIDDDKLVGDYFATDYRCFLAWHRFGFPGAPMCNGFAMPALRSRDGAFMLGEMAATTANAGRLYFPAGTPEPGDVDADGCVDFEANILRELAEETGLGADEIRLAPRWTVVFAGPLAAFMRIAECDLTAAALQDRLVAFNATQDAPELIRLVPVWSPADFDDTRMPPYLLRYLETVMPQAR